MYYDSRRGRLEARPGNRQRHPSAATLSNEIKARPRPPRALSKPDLLV
jgi:hypothetical protein